MLTCHEWFGVEAFGGPQQSLSTELYSGLRFARGKGRGFGEIEGRCRVLGNQNGLDGGPLGFTRTGKSGAVFKGMFCAVLFFIAQLQSLGHIPDDRLCLLSIMGPCDQCDRNPKMVDFGVLDQSFETIPIGLPDFGQLNKNFGVELTVAKQSQRLLSARMDEHLGEFTRNAFDADLTDLRCLASDGSQGLGIDFEFEVRGESDRSKHSQLVFIKTFFSVADGPEDLVSEIPLPLHKVNHLVIQGVEEKSIDREVAAERVLSGMTELDGVGPSAIGVADVLPARCDLDGGNVPFPKNGNDAERLADRQRAVSAK